jgi:hypothetical protein
MTITRFRQLPMECVTGETRCRIMYDTCAAMVSRSGCLIQQALGCWRRRGSANGRSACCWLISDRDLDHNENQRQFRHLLVGVEAQGRQQHVPHDKASVCDADRAHGGRREFDAVQNDLHLHQGCQVPPFTAPLPRAEQSHPECTMPEALALQSAPLQL